MKTREGLKPLEDKVRIFRSCWIFSCELLFIWLFFLCSLDSCFHTFLWTLWKNLILLNEYGMCCVSYNLLFILFLCSSVVCYFLLSSISITPKKKKKNVVLLFPDIGTITFEAIIGFQLLVGIQVCPLESETYMEFGSNFDLGSRSNTFADFNVLFYGKSDHSFLLTISTSNSHSTKLYKRLTWQDPNLNLQLSHGP